MMQKDARDGSRATVHVFVVAPEGEINVPFMQVQRDVTNGMSQIKSYQDSLKRFRMLVYELMALFGNVEHWKDLASVKVYPS